VAHGKTRIVHLADGQLRQEADNANTHIAVYEDSSVPHTFRSLFIDNYAAIRRECTQFGQPGLAVIALDRLRGTLSGTLCVAAKPDLPNSAIIGRHGMADLYLDGDSSLSLRHLVLMVSPLAHHDDVHFRMVDLRTSAGFFDEHGQRFEAMQAEGPLFVRCGSYVLYCLPTGDSIAWPESPEDGWECIPERVYLRGAPAEPDRWNRKKLRNRTPRGRSLPRFESENLEERGAVTLVHSVAGPVRARARLLESGETPVGTLRISSDAGIQTIVIGPRAARQGILLGRYQRCDIDGVNVLTHDSISRVHVLVIDIDGSLYAVDAGSTHGTWLRTQQREVRITPLVAGEELMLGEELAVLRWSPADPE
jgi:hypothetical protein